MHRKWQYPAYNLQSQAGQPRQAQAGGIMVSGAAQAGRCFQNTSTAGGWAEAGSCRSQDPATPWSEDRLSEARALTLEGYNLAGCCSDSGGMRMSSKNPRETGSDSQGQGLTMDRSTLRGLETQEASPLPCAAYGAGVIMGICPPTSESHVGLCLYHSHTLSSHQNLRWTPHTTWTSGC